ncbi:hypothetical protein DMW99_15480 [Pseudomonas chlororaphis]|nr:hypothetical protein DMW99_15480 [Pseudomonas chlororaphis]
MCRVTLLGRHETPLPAGTRYQSASVTVDGVARSSVPRSMPKTRYSRPSVESPTQH